MDAIMENRKDFRLITYNQGQLKIAFIAKTALIQFMKFLNNLKGWWIRITSLDLIQKM